MCYRAIGSMKLVGMMADITAPYAFGEALIYDRLVAPAVLAMVDRFNRSPLENLPSGARVLDVGCGGGHLLAFLAGKRPDLRMAGIDLAKGQVVRARRRTGGRACTLVRGSALELPFGDGCFELVASVASIKHWPDRSQGLAECVRVLRPGGWLMVVEADRGCHLEDAREFVSRWRFPRAARTLMLAVFRTWIAWQALDLDEVRELARDLPIEGARVERIHGTPALALSGRRA